MGYRIFVIGEVKAEKEGGEAIGLTRRGVGDRVADCAGAALPNAIIRRD